MQNDPKVGRSIGRVSRGLHPQIGHRDVWHSDRDGVGLVGVEPTDYRYIVEGLAFNTARGKGTMVKSYHRSSRDSGECSSRLHTVVQEIV